MIPALIGSRARVITSQNTSLIGLNGTVLDETKNMVTLLTDRGPKMVPKSPNIWEIRHRSETVRLDGASISKKFHERVNTV